MNPSSTSPLSPLSAVAATPATSRVSPSPSSLGGSSDNATTASTKTKLSKLGEMMSKLQDLETTDPAKAKQVLTSIASTLADKAKGSRDPRIQALADKFTQAANTGDLSGLRSSGPPPGVHPGGHHHGPPLSSSEEAPGASRTNEPKHGQVARYSQTDSAPRIDLESIVSNALSSASA